MTAPFRLWSSIDGAHASSSSSSASAAAWRSPLTTLLVPPGNLELTRQEQVQQHQQEALEHDGRQLQSRLLDLVATAADASQDDRPLWGPVKDPIDSLWAFVSWKPTAPDKSITKTSFQTSPVRNTSSQVSGMETPSPRPPPLHPASPMQTFTKDWQRGEGKGGATTPTVQSLSSLVSGGLGRG